MAGFADEVVEVYADTATCLFGLLPHGWARRVGNGLAVVSAMPVSLLNGVWATSPTGDLRGLSGLLGLVSAAGVPFCLQSRPGADTGAVAALASSRVMMRDADIPLMVLTDLRRAADTRPVEGVRIRQVGPADLQGYQEVLAAGFGMPMELAQLFVGPEVLASSAVRAYVGDVGGRPVCTALGVFCDGGVGVFNVATDPRSRGRGYGGAVTAAVVGDALLAGSRLACLQSSALGYRLYERLGFHTVEWWPCWTAPRGIDRQDG